MSPDGPAGVRSEGYATHLGAVPWARRGTPLTLLVVVSLVVMAAALLTDGMGGPVLLHQVREHVVVVGVVVAGASFATIRSGVRAETVLLGALGASLLTIAGVVNPVSVVGDAARPASDGRALVVHAADGLDGEDCVVVQSGSAPWSSQERVLCRSGDVPESAIVQARWDSYDHLRVTFGDRSFVDRIVR